MLVVSNCYEKIINNYLESMYLSLMSIYNDSNIVINAIYKAFEKIFVVDYEYINFLTIVDKINDNINFQLKKFQVSNYNEKVSIIDERVYLFNFNIFNYFNELDNKIILYILIYKIDISKVSLLINQKEEYIIERIFSIVSWMKVHFNNVIKKQFVG